MKKLSKKKLSLIAVGIVAVVAVGAAAYVHYHRPASSSTTQGVKPDTSQTSTSDNSSASTNTKASGSVTPDEIPAPTAEGKPQSEATTPSPTTLTLTVVSSAGANPIMAITNKTVTGNCTFVFSQNGINQPAKTAPLNAVTTYSGCSYTVADGELTSGTWNVAVSATDSSGTATANGTVTIN